MIVGGVALAWHFTALHALADPRTLVHRLWQVRESGWAIPAMLSLYLVASATLFPNAVLNTATVLAFGTVAGPPMALGGSLLAAVVFYWIGRGPGRHQLRRVTTAQIEALNARLRRGGVAGMTLVRLLPIAPFAVVNVMAGAARVRLGAFVAGTLLGLLPGCLMVTAFGHQLRRMIASPDLREALLLAAIGVAGLVVLWGIQRTIAGPRAPPADPPDPPVTARGSRCRAALRRPPCPPSSSR